MIKYKNRSIKPIWFIYNVNKLNQFERKVHIINIYI